MTDLSRRVGSVWQAQSAAQAALTAAFVACRRLGHPARDLPA